MTPEDPVTLTSAQSGAPGRNGGVRRRVVLAWGMWDWGSSSFNAVITSFVFTPYVAKAVIGPEGPGGLSANTWLGISSTAAGILIFLTAPITGQRADAGGHRRRNLGIWSALVVLVMFAMFGVKNEPSYIWLALVLLAAGAIFQEFAYISYNAMLQQVSTPTTVGRVSGFGWSMGYFGGVILLIICYFGFIAPDVGPFGVTNEGGLDIRAVAVVSAVWMAVFAAPVLFAVPETPVGPARRRVSFFESYRLLLADIKALYRTDRNSVLFLIASALYRDGLTTIFTFGAVLAVTVYGLGQDDVLIFGIAANVLGALGALGLGRLEDRIGPKRVIQISLAGILFCATVLLFARGPAMFWVFGLLMTLWVGPAQSSSRSFLTRVAPLGREGEMFGLYATTGRAASFIGPALLALFSGLFSDRIGIVGIIIMLGAGTAVLMKVSPPPLRPTTLAVSTGSGT